LRKLVLAGSALGALVGPAMADDPAAPTSVFTWTRCYIGATVGGASGKSNVSWAPNPAGFSKSGATIAAGTLATMTSSGFAGGCNYQVNNWFVLGLEGDLQYTGLSATNTGTNPRLKVGNSFTETFSSDWLSTVRGRAGIANGQWLFFATAGWAQANVSFSDFIFYPFSSTTNAAS
jgi:opacity protein-like surface antigen